MGINHKLCRLLSLLLVFCTLLCSVSCGTGRQSVTPDDSLPVLGSVGSGIYRFEYDYSEQDETALRSLLDEFKALAEDGSDSAKLLDTERKLDEAYEHLSTQCAIALLYRSLDQKNEKYNENYLHSNELKSSVGQEIVQIYKRIYDSPVGTEFFASWSDEDIEDMLSMAQSYTPEVVSYLQIYDKLCTEYRLLDSEQENYKKEVDSIYRRQIENFNTLSGCFGYGNFYEYAYEREYERDFTPEDSVNFFAYVKETVLPLILFLAKDISEEYDSLSESEIAQMNRLLYEDMPEDELLTYADAFFAKIGGEIEKNYKKTVEEKNYILHTGENAEEGAYTTFLEEYRVPVIYFGPGYQNVFTFLHENGHAAAYLSDAAASENEEDGLSLSPTDLCEVHSQGAEWLFLASLDGTMNERAYHFLCEYQLYNNLLQMLMSAMIDAFEAECYREIPEDFDTVMKEVCDRLGGYDLICSLVGSDPLDYWRLVVVESPVYYISYPVSMLPAILLFIEATDEVAGEFSTAVEKYTDLFGSPDSGFLKTLRRAGLPSPFEKEGFSMLEEFCYAQYGDADAA